MGGGDGAAVADPGGGRRPDLAAGGAVLYAVGETADAVILTLFGALVIGLVDNLLRPILVGRDTKLPDYVVLYSTLGGLALFGITGFALGPLMAGLFVAFWQIFIQEFNTEPAPEDAGPNEQQPNEKQ